MGGRTLDQFLSRQKARNQKSVKTADSSQEQKQQRHNRKNEET